MGLFSLPHEQTVAPCEKKKKIDIYLSKKCGVLGISQLQQVCQQYHALEYRKSNNQLFGAERTKYSLSDQCIQRKRRKKQKQTCPTCRTQSVKKNT